ncbi:hypothetical protein [Cyclobacterium roseum]|nr:hypothetical protein [Cyclobacterium roseum]
MKSSTKQAVHGGMIIIREIPRPTGLLRAGIPTFGAGQVMAA